MNDARAIRWAPGVRRSSGESIAGSDHRSRGAAGIGARRGGGLSPRHGIDVPHGESRILSALPVAERLRFLEAASDVVGYQPYLDRVAVRTGLRERALKAERELDGRPPQLGESTDIEGHKP